MDRNPATAVAGDRRRPPLQAPAGLADARAELASFNARMNALLPSLYHTCSESVSPTSMGSAPLKYGADSRVAWDQIWTNFCDLALAGGPPHRGSLLEAPTPQEVEADPAGYQLVTAETLRGVRMTTDLNATAAQEPGWLTIGCHSAGMAAWLLRAVMAENVFARRRQADLQLPVGPQFRLAREIKNVVVALAKTCHYWCGHFSTEQQAIVTSMTTAEGGAAPLLEPPSRPEALARADEYAATTETMVRVLRQATGLSAVRGRALGWVGVPFADEVTAAWFVRAAIVENILARREGEVLYLPVPAPRQGEARFEAVERMTRLLLLWAARPRETPP